jgi:hypothetical protein
MLLVFECHDYGNGYFYRVQIWSHTGIAAATFPLCTQLNQQPRI